MADMHIRAQEKTVGRSADGTMVGQRGDRSGMSYFDDQIWALALEGRVYVASDADQNDVVTGQTSFANTTPTFLLDVPLGTIAIPLFANLAQAGTVAGGAIDVLFEIDDVVRYSTGGTSEAALCLRTSGGVTKACSLYSGATAVAGYGIMLDHLMAIPADVAPAVTEMYEYHQIRFRPPVPAFLVGPAAFLVYTYAGTTGPSWNWSIGWAELPA